jgi:hypothetical protein
MRIPNWAAVVGRLIKDLWKYFAGGQETKVADEPYYRPRPGVAEVVIDCQGNPVEIPECRKDIEEYMLATGSGQCGWWTTPRATIIDLPSKETERELLAGADFGKFVMAPRKKFGLVIADIELPVPEYSI